VSYEGSSAQGSTAQCASRLYLCTSGSVLKVPYLLCCSLTITSSFVVKDVLAEALQKDHGWRHCDAELVSSFAVPIAAQVMMMMMMMMMTMTADGGNARGKG
jgi:hypothetical protein